MSRDTIRALVDAATPGPWTAEFGIIWTGPRSIGEMDDECNAPLVAASRTAVPLLLAVSDALDDLLAEQFCPSSSGGTEGKWCLNHDDQPMVSDTECALVARCRTALTALEAQP